MTAQSIVLDSPVGPLRLETDGRSLTRVVFHARASHSAGREAQDGVLAEAGRQLGAYFAGTLTRFDLPIAPAGTPFQRVVWDALLEIPYGHTWSYSELAAHMGRPAAVRAAGAANGQNPIPIIIPCHRVIGRDGRLVGFGGGIAMKQWLLNLEQATLF